MSAPETGTNRIANGLLLAAAGSVALTNGLHSSPLFDAVLFLLRPAVPSLLAEPRVLFHVTPVFIVAITLLLAGVPAAIYERIRGNSESTAISMGIWLAGTLLLAVPGILGAIGYFDIE